MANKAKLINLAQKAMSRGQWEKAVSFLERVLSEDPSDVRTRLKLGDVHAKKGDRTKAAAVYKEVAEVHAEQGFFLKAVAVYKQVLKIEPQHPQAALRIAELHEQLGLTQDAMAHFQMAVPLLEASDMTDEVLQVLERLTELDPENIAARIKLAESLSREGHRTRAVAHFSAAASVLKQQARIEDYIKVAERLIFHDASRLEVVRDLAQLYLGRGDIKRGLAKLQICFQENPRDIETLTLLAKAFSDLGQVQKTVFVYRELARQYVEQDKKADADEIHRLILQLQPNDPEALRALDRQDELQVEEPEFDRSQTGSINMGFPPEPLRQQGTGTLPIDGSQDLRQFGGDPTVSEPELGPAVEVISRLGSEVGDVDRIVREAEVYIRYNLPGKAVDHLHKAFRVNPESVLVYQRLYEVYLSVNDLQRAAESLANVVRLHRASGHNDWAEEARIELIGLNPDHPTLSGGPTRPADEYGSDSGSVSVDLVDVGETGDISDLISVDAVHEDVDLDTGEVEMSDEESSLLQAPWGGVGEVFDDVEPTDAGAALDESPGVAMALGTKAGTPAVKEGIEDLISDALLVHEQTHDPGTDWEPVSGFHASGHLVDQSSVMDPEEDSAELEAAVLALSEGGLADKEDFSDATPSEEILLLTEQIGDAQVDEVTYPEGLQEVVSATPGPEEDDLDEVRFFIEAMLYKEALDAIEALEVEHAGHPALQNLRAMIQLSADIAEPEDSVDQSLGFLDDNAGRVAMNTSPSERAARVEADEMYDQGMAYKQIGQLEQATECFRNAAESGGSRTSAALEMLGRCLMDSGKPTEAVEAFQQALEFTDDTEVGINLRYELGATLERMGDLANAQAWFEACQALAPDHRDVATRVADLQENAATGQGHKTYLSG